MTEVVVMLMDGKVHATVPARDLERAKRFYGETLGLKAETEDPEGVRYVCGGGTALFVFPTRNPEIAGHTLASWVVKDLDSEMSELRSRGVRFEDYDMPSLKTVNGVAELGDERVAWFKDSEGNVLAVGEMTG